MFFFSLVSSQFLLRHSSIVVNGHGVEVPFVLQGHEFQVVRLLVKGHSLGWVNCNTRLRMIGQNYNFLLSGFFQRVLGEYVGFP